MKRDDLDFVTVDNSVFPCVKVYMVAGEHTIARDIAIFPIENGDVQEAESFAELFMEALSAG